MHPKYPNLFSPIRIGSVMMKNRIEMAPLGQSHYKPAGYATLDNLACYEQRAKSNAGLIVHGEASVHATGNGHGYNKDLLQGDGMIPDMLKNTELIHRYGGLASIELNHHGGHMDPAFSPTGKIYSPSAKHSWEFHMMTTPLDEELILELVNAFGTGAEVAKVGGNDMVFLHGGHGFLLAQFLSPIWNQRKDRFGGSLENRARFPLMVVDAVRKSCGADFPIEYRLSGDEFMENGMHLEETLEFCKMLDGKVDVIHVSSCMFWNPDASVRMFPNMFYPHGANVYMAEAIKRVVKHSKVAVVGALSDPEQMEEIIASGKADIVVVGRQFFADPDWVNKAFRGEEADITPCVRCGMCLSSHHVPYIPHCLGIRHCEVNPRVGKEWEMKFPAARTEKKRRILIAGGGPAGMEAAIEAADLGHEVILCEKGNHLGGGMNLLCQPAFKEDYRKYLQVLQRRIAKRNIEVRLHTEVTPALAQSLMPDVIFAAVGGEPVKPAIPGIDDPRVHIGVPDACTPLGQKIVIVGGGLAGAECGLDLQRRGKDVTVIEKQDNVAKNAHYLLYKSISHAYLEEDAPELVCNAQCTAITEAGVVAVDGSGKETVYPADDIIVALGTVSRWEAAESLRDCAPVFRLLGDCKKPGMIADALRDGYDAARGIE